MKTSITRRKAMTALAVVLAAAAISGSIPSAPIDADAELLRMGHECLKCALKARKLWRKASVLYEKTTAMVPLPLINKKRQRQFEKAQELTGYGQTYKASTEAFDDLRSRLKPIQRMPANSIAGIDLKLRIADLTDSAFEVDGIPRNFAPQSLRTFGA
jgi:hypothetical protein